MTDPQDVNPIMDDVEPGGEPRAIVGQPKGLRTDLPMWRMVLGLAIWPLLEQFAVASVWFVDSALAGHLPTDVVKPASVAVGGALYMMWLMGLLQGAAGVGATALVARAGGAGRDAEAQHAVGQSMMVAVVWGAINGMIFWIGAPWISVMFQMQDPLSHQLCTEYLQILAVVAPLRAVLFIGGACLRGAGDTRSPFFVMLAVNVVNILVSVMLVADFSPIGGHGVRGIAFGTATAWVVGGVGMTWLLLRGRGGVSLHMAELRPRWPMTRRLLRVGLPALFEHGGHWGGNLVVLLIVGHLARQGLEHYPIGSHNFAIRIEGFSFLPGFAFGIAAATLTGQYLGANDPVRARRAVWWAWVYGAGLMSVFGVLFVTAPQMLVRIVTDEPQFLQTTPRLLFYAGWSQIGFATALVLSGALRGAGDTRATMAITFFSTFGIRIPASWILAVQMNLGLRGIWIALACELALRGLLFLIWFLIGRWTRVRV